MVLSICSSADKQMAGKFAMVVWVLWNNRNNVVWNIGMKIIFIIMSKKATIE
jgi:hypothetical protein